MKLDPKIFDEAIEILESKGWNKGGMMGDDGSVCLAKALCLSCDRYFLPFWNYSLFVRKIINSPSISRWNDSQESVDDVIHALKLAREEVEIQNER